MSSIRVICVDSYQAAPIPDIDPTFSRFRGSDIKHVPVLRIFGITPTGEKVCLHVHGVFPYMYVPYTGLVNPNILAYRFAEALDAAINISLGSAKSTAQHVYKVQQVSGIPFYGYHRKKHHFFKIYLYNPAMIKRATELLQNGCILDQTFQPHEAHIPYTIQFMIDYNIYGMSMLNLKKIKYRHSTALKESEGKLSNNSENSINFKVDEKEYMPFSVTKQSVCEIECDAWAADILNREVIDKGIDLNPGIAAIWEEEKARRVQANLGGESQLTYPKSPERSQARGLLTDNDRYYQTRLNQRLCVLESQSDESNITLSAENISYPVPVPDDSKLLNASKLEIHAGPSDTITDEIDQIEIDQEVNEESMAISQASFNNISLSTTDLEIVDMLANLAQEQQQESQSEIDDNSILGSQKSEKIYSDFPLAQDNGANDEDEEEENEEVPDLNLTTLDLDSLNLSSWESFQEKSQETQTVKPIGSQIERLLESLKNSDSSDDIPQLDGPIDDENARYPNEENDITIERHEHIVCEYKNRGRTSLGSTTTTPRKRKRLSSSDEDDSRDGTKRPRTPRRTPGKRRSSLNSPSCPRRTYSPLSLEISGGPKTPKTSPMASPSARPLERGEVSRKLISRKRIFSPVKELNFEEENATSTDSSSAKPCLKTSDELITTDKNTPDSDSTLVEDSDDSLQTVVPSPPENPIIINESDSSDASFTKEPKSNLSTYSFPHDILHPLPEEEPLKINEFSFSQFLEMRSKTLIDESESWSSPSKVEKEDESDKEAIEMPELKLPSPKPTRETPEKSYLSDKDDEGGNISFFHSYLVDDTKDDGEDDDKKNKENLIIDKSKEKLSKSKLDILDEDKIVLETIVEEKQEDKKKTQEEVEKKPSQKMSISANQDSPFDLSLFRNYINGSDASKHLGVSCGQIEFNTRASVGVAPHENLGNEKAMTNYQFLTILCIEVHVVTRPNFLPDYRCDPITALFYAIHNDVPLDWSKIKPLECGVVIVDPTKIDTKCATPNSANPQQQLITYVETEENIFDSLLSIVERCDPEILIGYDLEGLSWGYVFQRASLLGRNLSGKISRIPSTKCKWEAPANDQQATPEPHLYNREPETIAELRLPGRIVLDVWRIMKHEIALTSYTYENVMFHVMNERVPHPSYDVLTKWWNTPLLRWRVIDHYSNRVIGVHRILHHLDIINRTSEHARLYGIQFYEVFSRGSQFRVESMMLRLAKPLNYIAVSPSAHQRGCMRAPESLPLIMEPESTIYYDPVVVLDFQSLYPSIIIAYNYCFSTCLGRIEHIGSPQPFEFGATTLKVPKKLALKLQNKLNFAPCGVAFVKAEVREGILPRMLMEILETRLMVKKAIKDHPKEDRSLQRALHSRQLGLKLIANVTYGYTAANFSGRMPCIEVGDSVVSKGKETLERAIKIVESTEKWGARVIYGDTDSLFVLLKGKSREEAFEIGAEIADAVTAVNPKPVKLKFEKVMQPCVLQTKKRYCGYMYENLNDEPVYLAKGIETVRRDGCPAVAKILEKSLRILFETKNMSEVKKYVTRQLDKILTGRASIQDLTFAKEFRGMRGYKSAACVPALELTKRLIQKDPCAIPRKGSRVPYIIVAGGPNVPLIRCVRSPMEVIEDPSLRPNATYYITKVIIPPLNRCFNLVGVDAYQWFMEMPHRQTLNRLQGVPFINSNRKQKTTISQYLCNTTCPSCGQICDRGICANCIEDKTCTLVVLYEKCRQYERIYSNIKKMCESCIGVMDSNSCTSLDCPIFYRRMQAQRDSTQISHLYDLIACMEHLN